MDKIRVREVTDENVDDMCKLCVPPEKRNDPVFVTGMELKKEWAKQMMRMWGTFADLAYEQATPVGLIQYEPLPEESIIRIHCIYVPEQEYWHKGIATRLLSHLIQEAKKPHIWFGDQPARGLVTRTFSGEKPGQYPARLFFTRKGFRQLEGDPDFLCYSLEEGFTYQPREKGESKYIPQEEDRGKAVIIYGPSSCPFSYFFLKITERTMKEIAPEIPVRWMNSLEEPQEAERRGNFEGCVVNARPIKAFVLDREEFQNEFEEALGSHLPQAA